MAGPHIDVALEQLDSRGCDLGRVVVGVGPDPEGAGHRDPARQAPADDFLRQLEPDFLGNRL